LSATKKKTEKTDNIDISGHELVPKHILLTKEEAQLVLDKYHIKPYQLPYIKHADPAIRHLNVQAGDIIMVIRRSPTAGEATVYRYVTTE
jgi:DNA-directed RNA polymerase subunit H